MGLKVAVSNVKAHMELGRVERRIQTLRESLEKLGVQTLVPMTCSGIIYLPKYLIL